ncbi:Por secretion system C-terminal sorting domain-containing protein [Hymenobacter psychrophilus]|uniref:Por secretion system C-terminal sorting domain-containing protein n=2 Tax=Hymenobacter psychrophilus TaxID=651662 RepID=A0A1H3KBG0_9BACT|nr:Por secretion system C-terminal sorting domain-containing protein [Hymenobacter psychrophilus]
MRILRPGPARLLVFLLLLLIGLLPAGAARAQSAAVGFGEWQLHLPTNRGLALAEANDRVYVAAQDAFFYFDKQLSTTRLLSRRDGLSDVGVSVLAYDSVGQQLLVVYQNTNLDLLSLKDGKISNLNDVLRKDISGTKAVYQVQITGRRAYLASSFGIVVLDLDKREIRDSYTNIGPGGTVVRVYATAVANGTLFAATSNGLMRTSLAGNPLDYRTWITDLPARAADPYRTLAVQQGRVVAGLNGDRLYGYTAPGSWQPLAGSPVGVEFRQLTPSPAGLLITERAQVTVLNVAAGTVRQTLRPTLVRDPRATLRAREGNFYVADFDNGLLRISPDGQQAEQFLSNAPAGVQAFSVLADARTNTVDVFTGGYASNYEQRNFRRGFYEFKQGQWTNITSATLPDLSQYPNPLDLTRGTRTPDGTLYVGSYGNGLLEWKMPGEFRLFNATSNQPNPLRISIGAPGNPNFVRVTDVTTDAEGRVWVVNRHQLTGQSGVFVFDPVASSWRVIDYFAGSESLDRIALDDAGNAWVSRDRQSSSGMVVHNPETRETRSFRQAFGRREEGGSTTVQDINEIYDVVKDRAGDIWVGTRKGPAFFANPGTAFDPQQTNPEFQLPYLDKGGVDEVGFPTLGKDKINGIAIDGANRKWFATENGLWLFTADASEALLHFTTANSPLPSNTIVDVAVNDKTGEVFAVTDAGVVSYRGDATLTEGKPSCASVFPNPIRPDYAGPVGISGLTNNASVKITDVSGRLVYQTRANGGTVTWNLNDYNGQRVRSGVYLVLTSDANGKNGCVSKIAVVSK